jgi:hypothetical protein
MTDSTETARSDLAFLKAVAEDRGPLPDLIGLHLLAAGVPYGLNFVLVWAIFAGLAPWWPAEWSMLTWVPGTLVYVPLAAVLGLKGRSFTPGPTARLFLAAWSAVGMVITPALAVMLLAQSRTGVIYAVIWPALSFALWGGAWAALGIIRRKLWHGAMSVVAVITALVSSALMGEPVTWLVMAAGILLSVALPGAAIVLKARWAD